jgi:hypothetical protein
MVADAVTYSETMLSALTALDAKEGLVTLLSGAGSKETANDDGTTTTTKFIEKEKLEPFAAISGKPFEEFVADLEKKAKIKIDVTPVLDNGKLRDDVINPMKKRLKSAMVSEEDAVNEGGIKKALSKEYNNLIELGVDDNDGNFGISLCSENLNLPLGISGVTNESGCIMPVYISRAFLDSLLPNLI